MRFYNTKLHHASMMWCGRNKLELDTKSYEKMNSLFGIHQFTVKTKIMKTRKTFDHDQIAKHLAEKYYATR